MKFESWKINKWFILVITLVFILVGMSPLIQDQKDQTELTSQKINYIKENRELLQTAIDSMKEQGAPEELIRASEYELQAYQQILTGVQMHNEQQLLLGETAVAKIQLEKAEKGNLIGATIPELKRSYEELRFFQSSDIKWIDPFYTADLPASNFLFGAFLKISYPLVLSLGALLIALFCSYEHRKKTNNFLWSTPQSPLKIMRNKLTLLFIVLAVFLTIGTVGIFAVAGVKSGVGNLNYPIFYLNQKDVVQQTTIIQYVTFLLAYTLLFFGMLILFGYLLQYFFKQFIPIFLCLEILILPLAIGNLPDFLPAAVAKVLPTSYWDFPRLLIGSNPFPSAGITLEKGLLILAVFILLFLISNLFIASKLGKGRTES